MGWDGMDGWDGWAHGMDVFDFIMRLDSYFILPTLICSTLLCSDLLYSTSTLLYSTLLGCALPNLLYSSYTPTLLFSTRPIVLYSWSTYSYSYSTSTLPYPPARPTYSTYSTLTTLLHSDLLTSAPTRPSYATLLHFPLHVYALLCCIIHRSSKTNPFWPSPCAPT